MRAGPISRERAPPPDAQEVRGAWAQGRLGQFGVPAHHAISSAFLEEGVLELQQCLSGLGDKACGEKVMDACIDVGTAGKPLCCRSVRPGDVHPSTTATQGRGEQRMALEPLFGGHAIADFPHEPVIGPEPCEPFPGIAATGHRVAEPCGEAVEDRRPLEEFPRLAGKRVDPGQHELLGTIGLDPVGTRAGGH